MSIRDLILGINNLSDEQAENEFLSVTSSAGAVVAQTGTPTSMVKVTQAQYNALTPNANTLYIIVG
jgi:hypothetical protein